MLLDEVWGGRDSTLEYPANSLVVFPAESRPRSFLWHSSRLALPSSVTLGSVGSFPFQNHAEHVLFSCRVLLIPDGSMVLDGSVIPSPQRLCGVGIRAS